MVQNNIGAVLEKLLSVGSSCRDESHGRDRMTEQEKTMKMKEQKMTNCYRLSARPIPHSPTLLRGRK